MGAAYFTELFPANVRYTGSSLGYQLSGLLFGAPIPIIAAMLVNAAGGRPWYAAAFLSLLALLAALASYLGPDERKRSPSHEQEQEPEASQSFRRVGLTDEMATR